MGKPWPSSTSSIMEPKLGEYELYAGLPAVPKDAALRCLGGCSFWAGMPGNALAPGWKMGALAGRLEVWALGVEEELEVVFRSLMTRCKWERASLSATVDGAGESDCSFG